MDLQVRDVARILDVSEKTLYRWLKAGTIPFHRVGDLYRFNRAEILEWATATGMQLSPEILVEPVKILFTLISPTVGAHLHLLSRLAFALRQPEFKAALKREALRDELLEKLALAEAALPAAPPSQPA